MKLLVVVALTAVCALKQKHVMTSSFSSPLLDKLNGKHEIVRPLEIEGQHGGTAFAQKSSFKIQAFGKEFHVEMEKNDLLFSAGHTVTQMDVNSKVLSSVSGVPEKHCYYHGTVKGDEASFISLSTCDGLHGIIHAHGEVLGIEPGSFHSAQFQTMAQSSVNLVDQDHILFRHSDLPKVNGIYRNRVIPSYSLQELENIVKGKSEAPMSSDEAMLMYLRQVETETLKSPASRKLMAADTHYVELVVVLDTKFITFWKSTQNKDATQYARELVNAVDVQYRVQGPKAGFRPIRILLTEIIEWTSGDPIKPEGMDGDEVNVDSLLNLFSVWLADNLANKKYDNAQLFSGHNFESTVLGLANTGEMCALRQPCGSLSVNGLCTWSSGITEARYGLGTDSNTVAHEMGHNFGMQHDSEGNTCPPTGYVMAAIAADPLTSWSSCSAKYFNDRYDSFTCNSIAQTTTIAICGNGVRDEGEDCDCGASDCSASDPCCNGATCKFNAGATCSAMDVCCDKATCKPSPAGTVCRTSSDTMCGLPEKCDGTTSTCPTDVHQPDGLACHDQYQDKGSCWKGRCSNRMLSCQAMSFRHYGGKCVVAIADELAVNLTASGGCQPFICFTTPEEFCSDFNQLYYRYLGFRRGFPCGTVTNGKYDKVCSGGLRNDGIGSKCVSVSEAQTFAEEIPRYNVSTCLPGWQAKCYDPFKQCKVDSQHLGPSAAEKGMCDCYPIYSKCMMDWGCLGLERPNDIYRVAIIKTSCEQTCPNYEATACLIEGIDTPRVPTPPTAPTAVVPTREPTKLNDVPTPAPGSPTPKVIEAPTPKTAAPTPKAAGPTPKVAGPTAAPGSATAAPTAAPGSPTAAPGSPTAAPGSPTAAPGSPTAAPGSPTAAPGSPTAAPGSPTAAPGSPTPAPAPGQAPTPELTSSAGVSSPAIMAMLAIVLPGFF